MHVAILDDDAGRSLAELFAREIPEIATGVVHIERLARIPGLRAKVAVESRDSGVDAVDACVGRNAVHVRKIQETLGEERLDIVPWSTTDDRMIRLALAPMRVARIELHAPQRRATVVPLPGEGARGAGDDGAIVALASQLAGWDIVLSVDSGTA